MSAGDDVSVRVATRGDVPAVMNVLDGAALATDLRAVRRGIDRGAVLVAVAGNPERVVGALVADGPEITAVAVRPGRRGQGIGTALVAGAAADRDRLTAEFDPALAPFWASLDFEIDRSGDRYRGVRGARELR